ncbi:FkbM family methyltransferase [Streptomyces sp. MP131-18]|uniref:FkbM family methyltransferase n=1 Tax=Streptomyces sp. MP131-18 TaxID=1857892 RepID=UPI00097C8864|nr:FkbM family methyltransferase [Streptomyces sp. MP131-18]ONK10269.1 31-O-demethyl-FK506 methyltransferase FkbM [Streptomyces sp. MP131-18]
MTGIRNITLDTGLDFWAPHEAEAHWQYEEIFKLGCYSGIRLPPGAYVIDVGANIGLFTYFLKRGCPTARVRAFEPMPEALASLRRNIEAHGLTGITIEECALGSGTEDEVPFVYYPQAPGNSTRYPEEKELQIAVLAREAPEEYIRAHYRGYSVPVQVARLSSYLVPGERVDLLKIDVEGAELDVLRGVDTEHWPLIGRLVLEVQDLDGRLDAIGDLLRGHGFVVDARPSPLIPEDVRTFLVHAVRPG